VSGTNNAAAGAAGDAAAGAAVDAAPDAWASDHAALRDSSAGLLGSLDLRPIGAADGSGAAAAASSISSVVSAVSDVFEASHQRIPSGRAYGGEVVAQAAEAVTRTVDAQRPIHSLHGYFLRAADVTRVTTWEVERLRDGRTVSSRAVRGHQDGRVVFQGLASFQMYGKGAEHAVPMPDGIPDPESLPTSAEVLAGTNVRDTEYWSHERSFDMRHWPSPLYVHTAPGDASPADLPQSAPDLAPFQVVWLKSYDRLLDDPRLHRTALAYLCDYTMLEPALRRHGTAWSDEGLMTASLDHAMWWHRDARVDEWIAFVQESPAASAGRGTGYGRLYTRSGELIATVMQEGVLSLPDDAG
jgi:acyl-CoA thioesterase-2